MYSISKRILDFIFSAVILVVLTPLYLVIAAAVKVTSSGPVFYVHHRVGYRGKNIKVYKFRTMVNGADKLEETLSDEELEEYRKEYKLKKDPRVTGVGRFLRHTSLDELPQFWNVLIGDMSIIGPRPVLQDELSNYSKAEQETLVSVKPGISGYWQVYGRGHATYESGVRQEQEMYYVRNASLKLDIKLFFMTFSTIIRGRGNG